MLMLVFPTITCLSLVKEHLALYIRLSLVETHYPQYTCNGSAFR